MSESELLQALYASTQVIISLFSMFVTIVSGYVVGLYLFLKHAPAPLRLLAFLLLAALALRAIGVALFALLTLTFVLRLLGLGVRVAGARRLLVRAGLRDRLLRRRVRRLQERLRLSPLDVR